MTSPSPSISPAAVPSNPGNLPGTGVAEIDRSCRWPVLILFLAAALWLGLSGLFGLLTAIKAHAPGFLSQSAWLTYGRVRPFGANAFVYGFVLQAGLGLTLWMCCRLGRNLLYGSWMLIVGTAFWNLGLFLGQVWILAGSSTGYEWLELPRAVSPILFSGYLLVAIWALINLHWRQDRDLYVSQWFLLTGLLWFPWIYATAQILLLYLPVRGVMQAVVNGWYVHNLFELGLGSFGLASIFYFLPKLTGRPLHSRGMALFGFWFLVVFAGWGGARVGEPVPNWISGVSVVARVFLLLPICAFALSWYGTIRNPGTARSDVVFRFTVLAAVAYLLAAVLAGLAAHPALSGLTVFTLYDQGVLQLKLHGFFGLALAGAVYYVAPRVAGCAWHSPGLIRVHFWSAALGVALVSVAMVVGGLLQGAGINQPATDFLRVVRKTVPFLGIGSLAATLLLISYALFLFQVVRLVMACCPYSLAWLRSSLGAVLLRTERRSAT